MKRRYGTFPCRQIRNIWIKDPTLFDGLGPCFGLVQITGSILLRYVLTLCIELAPTTEATKVDNLLKEQEGMSKMVTVTLRNLGVGQGGVDGVFPQHTPEQARRVIETWFHKTVDGAVSVSILFRPSMS